MAAQCATQPAKREDLSSVLSVLEEHLSDMRSLTHHIANTVSFDVTLPPSMLSPTAASTPTAPQLNDLSSRLYRMRSDVYDLKILLGNINAAIGG